MSEFVIIFSAVSNVFLLLYAAWINEKVKATLWLLKTFVIFWCEYQKDKVVEIDQFNRVGFDTVEEEK